MKLPRDVSGVELCKHLKVFGYEITRQKGSHLRLTTQQPSQYHIPDHNSLKIGTLNSILEDVAKQADISKAEVINRLFY